MRKLAVAIGLIVAVVIGGYFLLDQYQARFAKPDFHNAKTFPRLPTAPAGVQYFPSNFDQKVRIAWRSFVVPPAVEKGTLVISSGRTESMLIYDELIADFNAHGYSVYIHDHAGQGLSSRLIDDPEKSYVDDFRRYVADLTQFVKTVKGRPLYLVAHSMGGGIASLCLEDNDCGSQFKAAVLVTPMHAPKMPGWAIPGAKVMRLVHASGYALGQGPYRATETSDITHSSARLRRVHEAYDKYPTARLGGPTHAWLVAASNAGRSAVEHATSVKVPVLIIQAGNDTAVDNAAQGEFCKQAPHCTGFLLERSYHAVFNESDEFRAPALAKIVEFLDNGGHLAPVAPQVAARK